MSNRDPYSDSSLFVIIDLSAQFSRQFRKHKKPSVFGAALALRET